MPSLHVVSDPADEPEIAALAVAVPHLDPTTGAEYALVWFLCGDKATGAAVRTHVLTALNSWAVDTDTIADAMVLVSELVTNVHDHTASESVGIRVRLTADRVVVSVVEQAVSDAPTDGRLGATTAPEPPRDRGRGLRILDSLASEWGFVRSGGLTTTWFALPADSPAFPGHEPQIRRF